MLILSIGLFVLAIVFGFYLLFNLLVNKTVSKKIAIVHGVIAALGLLTLAWFCFMYHQFTISLIIFLLAAAGGATIFFLDLTGKKIPSAMPIFHALIAIAGFILLIFFANEILSTHI